MSARKPCAALVVFVLVGLTSAWAHDNHDQAQHEDARLMSDRLSIALVALTSRINTDLAAGRGLGVSVDVEKTLGYDEDINTFGIEGFYRFSKKGAVRLLWTEFERDASGYDENGGRESRHFR